MVIILFSPKKYMFVFISTVVINRDCAIKIQGSFVIDISLFKIVACTYIINSVHLIMITPVEQKI